MAGDPIILQLRHKPIKDMQELISSIPLHHPALTSPFSKEGQDTKVSRTSCPKLITMPYREVL